MAPNPILQPLKAGPAEAPARPALSTEDVEARQAVAAATCQQRSSLLSLRRLGGRLARSASGRARCLRGLLAAAAAPRPPAAEAAAVCSGCPGRRLGCAAAAAGGWTSTHVNWAAGALA